VARRESKKAAGAWFASDFAPRLAGMAILGAVVGGYARAWTLGTWPGGHPWSGIGLAFAGLLLFAASRPRLRAAIGIAALLATGLWLWDVI